MRKNGAKQMGRFSVEFVVANYVDMEMAREGSLSADKVRRETVQGVVDSGAKHLVLPKKVVDRLGVRLAGKRDVRYADNRVAKREVAEGVYVEILGRHTTIRAIVEPNRDTALIGAIVLEDLDFLIDCLNERLVPRYPKGEMSEIE